MSWPSKTYGVLVVYFVVIHNVSSKAVLSTCEHVVDIVVSIAANPNVLYASAYFNASIITVLRLRGVSGLA